MGGSAFIRRTRHWRAGCTQTCLSGSGGGGWIPSATRGWPPTSFLDRSRGDVPFGRVAGDDERSRPGSRISVLQGTYRAARVVHAVERRRGGGAAGGGGGAGPPARGGRSAAGGRRRGGPGAPRGALVGGLAPPHDPVAAGAVVLDPGEAAAGEKRRRRRRLSCARGSPDCCGPDRPARGESPRRSVGCYAGMRKSGSIVGTKPRTSSRHAGGGLTDKNGYSATIVVVRPGSPHV